MRRNTCQRLVGVEWEFNHRDGRAAPNVDPILKWASRWKTEIHPDSSCGQEAVTPPIAGDQIRKCLRELASAFDGGDATCDRRCSIHVHVDARDVTWPDMMRLLTVYAKVEPALYLIAGQNRLASQYCRPCGEEYTKAMASQDRRGSVLGVAMGRPNDTTRAYMRSRIDKKGGARYKGLNIMPWIAGRSKKSQIETGVRTYLVNVPGKKEKQQKTTSGRKTVRTMAPDTTVEFRIHRNTHDPDRVTGWAMLCASIVDWVVKHTDDEAEALPASAMQALAIMAPNSKAFIVKRLLDWKYVTRRDGGVKRRIQFNVGKFSGRKGSESFSGDGTYKIVNMREEEY